MTKVMSEMEDLKRSVQEMTKSLNNDRIQYLPASSNVPGLDLNPKLAMDHIQRGVLAAENRISDVSTSVSEGSFTLESYSESKMDFPTGTWEGIWWKSHRSETNGNSTRHMVETNVLKTTAVLSSNFGSFRTGDVRRQLK